MNFNEYMNKTLGSGKYVNSRDIWLAAQAELLRDPMVVDLRKVEWHDDDSGIAIVKMENNGRSRRLRFINKPKP